MPARKADSQLSMAQARQQIAKKFGNEMLTSFAPGVYREIGHISTGAVLVDAALGVGGIPRGRITEIYGPESSGKSSLALATAKQCQKGGEAVLYLDFEHSFDPIYAEQFGLDISDNMFVHSQPTSLEEGMKLLEFFAENNLVGLVIVDSLAAMATIKELEGDIGDVHMAPQARAMSQVFKLLVAKIDRSNVAVIFINHLKEVIGGYNPTGRPRYTTPGGKALKFYASVRMELRFKGAVKGKIRDFISGQMVEGNVATQIQATMIKNKVASPFRQGIFFLRQGVGVSDIDAVIEVASSRGIIRRNGSRYVLPKFSPDEPNANLGGLQATVDWFVAHPAEYKKLRRIIINKVFGEQPKLSIVPKTDESLDEVEPADIDAAGEEELIPADEPVSPTGTGAFEVSLGSFNDEDDVLPSIGPTD